MLRTGRTDNVKTVYPPYNFVIAGGGGYNYVRDQDGVSSGLARMRHRKVRSTKTRDGYYVRDGIVTGCHGFCLYRHGRVTGRHGYVFHHGLSRVLLYK